MTTQKFGFSYSLKISKVKSVCPSPVLVDGQKTEPLSILKYLGLLIDDYTAKKLKPLLGFYVGIKIFAIIDHGHVLYIDECSMPP